VNLNFKVWFLLPSNNKFCHQINGGNQSNILRTTKISNESFNRLTYGGQKTFDHHTISNKKLLIIVGLAMKNFPSL
jgi:hypothetical protein